MPQKLTPRPDGRYEKKVYLGNKKYKTVYGATAREVEAKAAAVRASIGKGLDVSRRVESFRTWAEYLLPQLERQLPPSEYRCRVQRLEYFCDYFGAQPIGTVRSFQIAQALEDLAAKNPHTGKPTSKRTLQAYRAVLDQVFRLALDNRVIEYNPVAAAALPRQAPTKERRALTREQVRWILDTPSRGRLAALLAVFAGLRRGEMTALTWQDIDFDRNLIRVNKAWDFKRNQLKATKTAAGMRTVPLTEPLRTELWQVRQPSGLVIRSAHGKQMTLDAWDRMLGTLLLDLEIQNGTGTKKKKCAPGKTVFTIPTFTWHELRHTYATLLFDADIPAKVAQSWLGHADISTTLQIYTHLSKEKEDAAAHQLGTALSDLFPDPA